LIQKPDVMLLDEPFPGVEDENVAMLVKTLRELADGGETILLVDHNISIVEELVDEVVLLARGAVQFVGSVAECVASEAFRDEYVGAGRDPHRTGAER
jgi:ABC-type branched-subunit amino acid transport system ATPase component